VLAVDGERVEVMLGSMPFTVERGDLRVPGAIPRAAGPGRPGRRTRGGSIPQHPGGGPSRGVVAEEPEDVPAQLMLVGQRVEEALEALDRYLDAAAVAGRDEVRIVHGHGTGRLRAAVRGFLRGHVHVARVRAGGDGEGGDGATVVTMRQA